MYSGRGLLEQTCIDQNKQFVESIAAEYRQANTRKRNPLIVIAGMAAFELGPVGTDRRLPSDLNRQAD
jgi:hypothetical protein